MRQRKTKEIELFGKNLVLAERLAFDVYTVAELYKDKTLKIDSDWIDYWALIIHQSLKYNLELYDKENKIESLLTDNTHWYEFKKHKEISLKNAAINKRNDDVIQKRKELEELISLKNIIGSYVGMQLKYLFDLVKILETTIDDSDSDKKKAESE